jgi:TolB-like protein
MEPEKAEECRAAEGPSQFDVYIRERNGQREGIAIKQGFCWPAFLFTWVWAFANRLWIPGAVLLMVGTIFNALFIYFSEDSPAIAVGFALITGAIALYVGFTGNDLRRAHRLAEGFLRTMTVRGTAPSQVLEAAGIPPAASLAYSRGGVIAASIFSAVAVFFIMWSSVLFVVGDRDASSSVGVIVQAGLPALLLWYRSLRPPMGFLKGLLWGGGGYLLAMPVFIMFTMPGAARTPSGLSSVQPAASRQSVAVLPFASVPSNFEQVALADEITRTLLSELAAIGAFHKVVRLLGSTDLSAGSGVPGIDWVVEGSVRRTESGIRLAVQLIHVPDNRHVWADVYDVPFERRTQAVRDAAAGITSYARGTKR